PGAKAPIHHFSERTKTDADHASSEHCDEPDLERLRARLKSASRRDRSRIADREGLLLNCLRVLLKEIVVKLAVALRGSFKAEKRDLRLIGLRRLRNQRCQSRLSLILTLFCDFVFALGSFTNTSQLFGNGLTNLSDLSPQSHHRIVFIAVA